MKMTNTYRLTLPDGRVFEGRTMPLDVVMAERQFGGINDSNKVAGTFYTVMLALKRKHHIEFDDFDDFLDGVEELVLDEQDDPSGNGAGPSTERPSPDSPTGRRSRPRASPRA